jgi:hypothetical protein
MAFGRPQRPTALAAIKARSASSSRTRVPSGRVADTNPLLTLRRRLADTLARDPAELEEDEEPSTADAEGLRRFLEGEVLPWFEARKKELANRPLIREQAFGESLDPDKLERLGRYEVHLDRKLERTLAMLLRLKDLRQGAIAG